MLQSYDDNMPVTEIAVCDSSGNELTWLDGVARGLKTLPLIPG